MTLCLQDMVPGIYEGSSFLDHLDTFNGFTCLWSKNAIYYQRSSGFVCREKATDTDNLCIFRLCFEQVDEKRTAINGHKAAAERSARLTGKPLRGNFNRLQGEKQVEQPVWIRCERWASYGQNVWSVAFFQPGLQLA